MFKRIILAAALAGIAFGASAQAAADKPLEYQMDPTHTVVLASWNHFGYSNPSAYFGDVTGTITYDADSPADSKVEVVLPMSGLDSFVPKLDEHLRSADFFDAAQYPEARFTSTSVRDLGDGKLEVTGDLALHGVTRPVVLAVTLNKAAPHPMMGDTPTIGFDATTTISRSAFGIDKYVPMVGDAVTLRITTEASVAGEG